MGSNQQCSLAWGEFGTSLVSTVQLLRCHGDLVDVTLAAGGRSFPAHKIVLSAASPFLLDLIKKLEELSMGSSAQQNLTKDVINSFLPGGRRRKRNRHKSGGGSSQEGGGSDSKWARGDDSIVGGGSDGGGDDPEDTKVVTGPQRAASDGEAPSGTNGEDYSAKRSGVSDQPAICPLCGATIRQSRNLRRHLELLHFGASTMRGGSLRFKSKYFAHQPLRTGEAPREGSPSPHPISMVVPANPLMVVGSDRLNLTTDPSGLLGPHHPLTIPTPTDLILRRHHDDPNNSPLYADSRTSRNGSSPTASTSHSALGGDVV
ncbi:uncharacterized protein LOC124165723 isoform X2 [Ischnura elegans]|uniref:uncharacterized protein LOC124165723 isoform X2 n=1 Tax=Ischnura elegans TaxID=197161 RepID=UPI001ED8B1EF|nr:uncharacterized protein LOC124165723 isoform X2 [Ischnura elegans]